MLENVRYVDSLRRGQQSEGLNQPQLRAAGVIAASGLLAQAIPSTGVATLHLRNVPDDVDAALATAARAGGVSKNRRAIEALRRGLGLDQVERSQLIEQIRQRRRPVEVDVAELIREDRPGEAA